MFYNSYYEFLQNVTGKNVFSIFILKKNKGNNCLILKIVG